MNENYIFMEKYLSYQAVVGIAIAELVILTILIVLIIKRKIGRPLTEAELIEKKRKEEEAEIWLKKEFQRLQVQESKINGLKRPLRFVGRSETYDKLELTVQDGDKQMHSFSVSNDKFTKESTPFFCALFKASWEPWYFGKKNAILLN